MAERKTQLYFYDDNTFQFIKRPLQHFCLVEKEGDKLKRAWKHFYGNQILFKGYKNMSADMITLGFSRDIILDPFDKIPKGEKMSDKPDLRIQDGLKKWIARIGENMRHIYRSKRQTSITGDRISWALIAVMVIMIIGWLIKFTV